VLWQVSDERRRLSSAADSGSCLSHETALVGRPTVYSLTKFGIIAFGESLRQELIKQRVRVSVVEPGTVDTELVSHLREDVRKAARSQVASVEAMHPEDIADAVSYIVTRDRPGGGQRDPRTCRRADLVAATQPTGVRPRDSPSSNRRSL